jgi:hypothetical protein
MASAQSPPPTLPLDSGRTVRVTTAVERSSGVLLAPYSRASLALQFCRALPEGCVERTVPSREILRLEVAAGTHARSGAIIGGATGAVAGGFIGLMVAGLCDAASCPPIGRSVLIGGVVGALPMGAIGGLIGSLFPRWGPAP